MEDERKKEVTVGTVILVSGLVLLLGNAFHLVLQREDTYTLHIDFDHQGSLAVGSQVTVSGVVAGRIDRIRFLCDQGDGHPLDGACVRITVEIQSRFAKIIHDDAEFLVGSQGMLGEAYVDIDPGSHDKPILVDGAYVRGTSPPRLDVALARGSEVIEVLGDVTKENRYLFASLSKFLSPLLATDASSRMDEDRLGNWLGSVHSMTEEGADAVSEAHDRYVDNPKIDHAINQMDEMTTDLDRDIDPTLQATLIKVKQADDILSEVTGDDQEKLRVAIEQVTMNASRADEALTKMSRIVKFVEQGEGTLGSFMMKEELYIDLHEMIMDLKHNPWKLLWKD